MTTTNPNLIVCRHHGHVLPEAPPMFAEPEEFAAFVGEGRTDVCVRCGTVRVLHPNGNRLYRYPETKFV